MKHFFYSLLIVLFIGQCRHKEENPVIQFPGKPDVPSSIKKEHEYLLDQIHKITLFQDSAGLAAIKLNDLMQHHFKEEEDFVLPPLGLLSLLATDLFFSEKIMGSTSGSNGILKDSTSPFLPVLKIASPSPH